MNIIPDLVPISQLRLRQNQILASLSKGPIVLTQRGVAGAVLVSPQQWNSLIRELEGLSDALAAVKTELNIAIGKEELTEWESFEAELNAIPA